jgi:hypothetical protein
MTVAHLRTYTINSGMMESWLSAFADVVPVMEKAGITVESAWTNEDNSQFIWIRSYGDSVENIEKCEAAFYGSQQWLDNVDFVRSHVAHMDIKVIKSI